MNRRSVPLPVDNATVFDSNGVEGLWLGQGGFLFNVKGTFILVDPYLSNYLEDNHGNLPYDHTRLIDPPITEDLYPLIDLVVITHAHEDHLDPWFVQTFTTVNENAMFVIPAGCARDLKALGVGEGRTHQMMSNGTFSDGNMISISAFGAAHPAIPTAADEEIRVLSYRFFFDGYTILFGGDTVLYPQWVQWVHSKRNDLLILPVNGRDPIKEANGIVGNMSFHEAVLLSQYVKTPLLGTHFGMFAFNTVDKSTLADEISLFGLGDQVSLCELGVIYSLIKE